MPTEELAKKTVIILPVYNKCGNVEKIIRKIFNEIFKNTGISVIVVDSNSDDGSREEVLGLQNEYPNLKILFQKEKQGLASAYTDGFLYALKENYEIFVQMDTDFQHPPEVLPEMIKKTENYDLIIGSRYVKNGSWFRGKFFKHFISIAGNIYAAQFWVAKFTT